jgi:hypothetical protein
VAASLAGKQAADCVWIMADCRDFARKPTTLAEREAMDTQYMAHQINCERCMVNSYWSIGGTSNGRLFGITGRHDRGEMPARQL